MYIKRTKALFSSMKKRGFSLIEMLVVISMISVFVTISMVFTRTANSDLMLRSGQATVLQAIESARNKASSGVDTGKHGVHIESDRVTIFHGDSYSGSGTVFFLPSHIVTDQGGLDVVFDRITGYTSAPHTITVSNAEGDSATIKIESNGFVE